MKRNKNEKITPKVRVRLLSDRVLVKEELKDVQEKTASGIIIPSTNEKDSGVRRGIVMATGPGRVEDGKLMTLNVSVGDKILFQWGERITIEKEEYYIVRESEIIGVIK